MEIYLITRNQGKLKAAQTVFANTPITLLPVEHDYPEIQADTSIEIARYAALQAARELGAPAIREDHSLYVSALGIPGPYMSFFERKISAGAILKLLNNFEDRTGYFEVATAFAEPSGAVEEYIFQVPITFSREERGTLQTGWNRIIMLDNETRTLAEYPETERIAVWNKNYVAIAQKLTASPQIS